MPNPLWLRLGLTALWVVTLTCVVCWWTATFRTPGLLLWTLVSSALFAATAILLYHTDAFRRENVRGPLIGWLAVVLGIFALYTLVPILIIQGQVVRTISGVAAIDLVIPMWVGARAILLIWERRLGTRVLLAAVPLGLVIAFAAMIPMPGRSYDDALPPLTPSQTALADRLRKHVAILAGDIGERHFERPDALARAEQYVVQQLSTAGYSVNAQTYRADGRPYRNYEVTIPGGSRRDEIVIVGGHYDSVRGAPGADDNASAIAALIELARTLRNDRPARTIRLVAFANEEPPHFQTAAMGSRVYAREAARLNENLVAVFSLETIGYYSDKPGSQRYPWPFNLFYPDHGDFIAFVGDLASQRLVRRSVGAFRLANDFPAHGVAAAAFIPGVNWSDHASFWLYGFHALMITDTAPFRYDDYHTIGDTPEKLDYSRMARVVEGIAGVIRSQANPATATAVP